MSDWPVSAGSPAGHPSRSSLFWPHTAPVPLCREAACCRSVWHCSPPVSASDRPCAAQYFCGHVPLSPRPGGRRGLCHHFPGIFHRLPPPALSRYNIPSDRTGTAFPAAPAPGSWLLSFPGTVKWWCPFRCAPAALPYTSPAPHAAHLPDVQPGSSAQ